jgi:hypothetical protein
MVAHRSRTPGHRMALIRFGPNSGLAFYCPGNEGVVLLVDSG